MTRSSDSIVYGTGKYGHPVTQNLDHMGRLAIICGTTQTGKTRLANSVMRQQSAILGSGQIIINGKPDEAFTAAKARDAQRMNRTFLQFSLAAKGGVFVQSHPYQPPVPCHYDPLARGSGAVRARMLVDSVIHSSAGEVYRRNALEVAALCWDLARLTGGDYEEVLDDQGQRRKKPALQVLLEQLDTDLKGMSQSADHLTPAHVLRIHPHMHPADAAAQVQALQTRAHSLQRDSTQKSATIGSSIADLRSIVSSYLLSSAFYPRSLSEGASPSVRIDLLRAIIRGEIVEFSLSAADYRQEASMLTTMILIDLQNTASTLREYHRRIVRSRGHVPWGRVLVQIEEFGSLANPASADALVGLVNKSADVGLEPYLSTQSLADLRKIGDNPVYLEQIMGVTSDLFSLQIGEAADDTDFCKFSSLVQKKIPTEETEVSNNRFKVFTGARQSSVVRATDTELTRVPEGSAQALANDKSKDLREMLWITKTPKLKAVHTTGDEGPNNWYETIRMVPVGEPPFGWDPFADPDEVALAEHAARLEAWKRMLAERDSDGLLQEVRQINEHQLSATTVAEAVDELGEPSTHPAVPATGQDANNQWDANPVTPGGDDTTAPADEDNPFDLNQSAGSPSVDMPKFVNGRTSDQ